MTDLTIQGADPSASGLVSPEPSVTSGEPSGKLLPRHSEKDSKHVVEAHPVSHCGVIMGRLNEEGSRDG